MDASAEQEGMTVPGSGRSKDSATGWLLGLVKRPWTFWIPCVAGVVWLAVAWLYTTIGSEQGRLMAVTLLTIPVAGSLCLLIVRGHPKRFPPVLSGLAIAMVFAELLGLLFYALRDRLPPAALPVFAELSVVGAFVIVAGALVLASRLIRGGGGKQRTPPERMLAEEPFGTICFFLSTFCFVATSLSFGLAFHDQGLRIAGTVGADAEEALDSGADQAVESPGAQRPPRGIGLYAAPFPSWAVPAASGERQAFRDRPWVIEFERGRTHVVLDDTDPSENFEILDGPEYIRKQFGAHNSRQLNELTAQISAYQDRERVRVLLVGHADDTTPSNDQSRYDNNREVSEARIQQVRLEILRRLERADPGRSKNVEWLSIPLSSESQFLDENRPYRTGDREPRLSVEVDVLPSPERVAPEEGRAFELLDYIYFTFYTITTTGFGDIIPVSPFTKFVATIANLFEVVFIVIFFNVLVSFLRDGRQAGSDRATATEGTP